MLSDTPGSLYLNNYEASNRYHSNDFHNLQDPTPLLGNFGTPTPRMSCALPIHELRWQAKPSYARPRIGKRERIARVYVLDHVYPAEYLAFLARDLSA